MGNENVVVIANPATRTALQVNERVRKVEKVARRMSMSSGMFIRLG